MNKMTIEIKRLLLFLVDGDLVAVQSYFESIGLAGSVGFVVAEERNHHISISNVPSLRSDRSKVGRI
jgi:hypothetical protein